MAQQSKNSGLLQTIPRSTIYNKLNVASCHYDAKFPKQIRVGKTSVRWIESEINSWVEECVKLSRQSHGSMAAIISAMAV